MANVRSILRPGEPLEKWLAQFVPHLSIDCVVFGFHGADLKLLLLKWKGIDTWTLPGGFVGLRQSMDGAAHQVLQARTGLRRVHLRQFHAFGDLGRNHDLARLPPPPMWTCQRRNWSGPKQPPRRLPDPIRARYRARDAYRARLADLDAEIADAQDNHDLERATQARTEKDALIDELSTAYGLGGRPRRLGDSAERARKAVTADPATASPDHRWPSPARATPQ